MTSKQLSEKLTAARKQAESVETTVRDVAERLATLKTEYQRAVESGEPETALDARDDAIRKAERELTREQIRLSQRRNEVSALEAARDKTVADEREQMLLREFDVLVEKFEMIEMALTEFISRKNDIESSIRHFTNVAATAGKNVHRLRVSDNLRRQISERLYPGYMSKTRPDVFRGLLADVLENHVRTILNIPRAVANGKAPGQPN